MKKPKPYDPLESKWWTLPLLAYLRSFEREVNRSKNTEKLWQIFAVASWTEASDAERLILENDKLGRQEVLLFAHVLRNLLDLTSELDRRLMRGFGTRAERRCFKNTSKVAHKLLVRFNARIQALGPDRLQLLPAEAQPAYEQALLDLNDLAWECPRIKVHDRKLVLFDPLADSFKNIEHGIYVLKKNGFEAHTKKAEYEVAMMKEAIWVAKGLGPVIQSEWEFEMAEHCSASSGISSGPIA